ncbi:DUF814 domain-containing protein [Candidatus Micrarchaeota archaeon]|nr:DUF814 domain-containing protein [Candidatus Micrarchaeota archaeon]
MKIKIFFEKNVHENAAYYYDKAKDSREKLKGIEEAIKETQKEIEKAKKTEKKKNIRIKREKQWFEKFHYYLNEQGRLMIGGRNAQQNDLIVSKQMTDEDLFFHADIQGGAVFVLKDGKKASEEELSECAQMAASYSNGWKNGNAAVDVYCVKKEQLTKNISGGFVPSGAFAILGERRWFRNMTLALKVGKKAERIVIAPQIAKEKLEDEMILIPAQSGKEKGEIAKNLAKRYKVHPDELLETLPNGRSKTKQENGQK